MSIDKHKRVVELLLVEDNAGDAKVIVNLLKEQEAPQFSINLDVVSDGEAAIDYLFRRGVYSGSSSPDMVLLDVNLPKKNGFEVLSEMRKEAQLAKIPVFMLTTSQTHEDMLRSYASGAASFITKPTRFADFEDVIKRFFAVEISRVITRKS